MSVHPSGQQPTIRVRSASLIAVVTSVTLLFFGVFTAPRPSTAMPQFAQATGQQCSACHTMVPLLNAYGRYIQRTGYATLDREALAKTFPVWVSESVNYDSTAGAGTGMSRYDGGSLGLHAIGYAAPQVTYHVQQWLGQGSQAGGLDTAWVAYAPSFAPDAHLFVGKILNPAPSVYSQTSDIDGPTASNTIVGEHDWGATYGNRWGTKINYVKNGLDLEAGYLMSGADLNGATNFAPGDKTFQWKAAFAKSNSPLEAGLFGSSGTLPVSTGTDRYTSTAAYVQLDPGKYGRPGLLAIYQVGSDSAPGTDASGPILGAQTSRGFSTELFQPLLSGNLLLGLRHDFNDAGAAGGFTNGNSINAAFNVPGFRYLHGYLEANLGGNSALSGASGGPTWKGMLWLTVPVTRSR